jgi:hypothetical protein
VWVKVSQRCRRDDYTGVRGGGAASQLARKLGIELVDLTHDGNTTHGVLADLSAASAAADLVPITAGGNDLLSGELPRAILRRIHRFAQRIEPLGGLVVINTIYDRSARAVCPGSLPPGSVGLACGDLRGVRPEKPGRGAVL